MKGNWNNIPATLPIEWEWDGGEENHTATCGRATIAIDEDEILYVVISDGHQVQMEADIPLSAIRALYRTLKQKDDSK